MIFFVTLQDPPVSQPLGRIYLIKCCSVISSRELLVVERFTTEGFVINIMLTFSIITEDNYKHLVN